MTVDLTWGTHYDDFIAEAWPQIRAHWGEVGSNRDILKLDPDHERYRRLERAGMLHILLARTEDGKIAGYLFMLVTKHPRDQGAIAATDDLTYVRPEFRRLGLGWKMIIEAERFAGECGVHVLMFRAKARRRNHAYLERRGFKPLEIVYSKVIAEPHRVEKVAE
jgi:GNAT superfamily N-acetyltransferase